MTDSNTTLHPPWLNIARAAWLIVTALAVMAALIGVAHYLTSPLRNRIQQEIDRRFYRRKYDAQQVLQHFGETVRDETDLDKLTNELVHVVQDTMQPKSVSVWLRSEDR